MPACSAVMREIGGRAAPPAEKRFPTGGEGTFGERGLAYRQGVHHELYRRFGCRPAGLFVQMSLDQP